MVHFSQFPLDIKNQFPTYFDVKNQFKCRLVCKEWNQQYSNCLLSLLKTYKRIAQSIFSSPTEEFGELAKLKNRIKNREFEEKYFRKDYLNHSTIFQGKIFKISNENIKVFDFSKNKQYECNSLFTHSAVRSVYALKNKMLINTCSKEVYSWDGELNTKPIFIAQSISINSAFDLFTTSLILTNSNLYELGQDPILNEKTLEIKSCQIKDIKTSSTHIFILIDDNTTKIYTPDFVLNRQIDVETHWIEIWNDNLLSFNAKYLTFFRINNNDCGFFKTACLSHNELDNRRPSRIVGDLLLSILPESKVLLTDLNTLSDICRIDIEVHKITSFEDHIFLRGQDKIVRWNFRHTKLDLLESDNFQKTQYGSKETYSACVKVDKNFITLHPKGFLRLLDTCEDILLPLKITHITAFRKNLIFASNSDLFQIADFNKKSFLRLTSFESCIEKLVSDNDYLYISTSDLDFYRYSFELGTEFIFQCKGPVKNILISNKWNFIQSYEDVKVYSKNWIKSFTLNEKIQSTALYQDKLYIGDFDGNIKCFRQDFTIDWSFNVSEERSITALTAASDYIIALLSDSTLAFLNLHTKKIIRKQDPKPVLRLTSFNDEVILLNLKSTEMWTLNKPNRKVVPQPLTKNQKALLLF